MARFTIQEYNRFNGQILAETVDGRQWAVQEPDFEIYLQRNGLLDWEPDYADHEGEHIQQTGQMEIEEYFAQDERYIKPDLDGLPAKQICGQKCHRIYQ